MADATEIFPGPPKWAMIGCEGPLGCRLIASKVVQDNRLRATWTHWQPYGYDPGDLTLSVTVRPPDVLIIDGPSWQQCITELWRQWSPEQGKIPAIEAGTRQGE